MTRNVALGANIESLSDLVSMLQGYRFLDFFSSSHSICFHGSVTNFGLESNLVPQERSGGPRDPFLLTFQSPKYSNLDN